MRPETGPMEFEGDWPGVFIRGDNALAYSLVIDDLLSSLDAGYKAPLFAQLQLKQLRKLLAGCDTRTEPVTQKLKPFGECKP